MINWQMKEEITFRCTDCGHIQHEMTHVCPACRNTRTISARPDHSVYRIIFGMNGGQRKESYRMLLTDEQATAFSTLPDTEAYNLFWSLWDQVVDASIDAGTDYEGICCGVSLVQEWVD